MSFGLDIKENNVNGVFIGFCQISSTFLASLQDTMQRHLTSLLVPFLCKRSS